MREAFGTRETWGKVAAGGGFGEAICGLVVIILAIIGLCDFHPLTLVGIAEIVCGAALFLAGGTFAAAVATVFEDRSEHAVEELGWGTGMATELIGGVCGIILGILVLFSINPLTLSAVAVLVFGGVMLAGGLARDRVEMAVGDRFAVDNMPLIREAGRSSAGVEMLVGVAVVILAILAIVAAYRAPATSLDLTLVGLLCLGVSALLSGLVSSGRSMRFMTR